MEKLTKPFKVVHIGKQLQFPLLPKADNTVVYPSAESTAVEFDTYSEAHEYVSKNSLVYK